MFEVNGVYENRRGTYTVLSFAGPKMKVRYSDGKVATLRVSIQERIWENIVAEREAAAARARKKKRKSAVSTTRHYIKTLMLEDDDLEIPGLKQRVAAAPTDIKLSPGDRLIYCAVDPHLFFAVATITTKPKRVKAKDYLTGFAPTDEIFIYPIDVDSQIIVLEKGIAVDSAELESLANHKALLQDPHQYHLINEDDFELLAELITEVDTESEDDEAEAVVEEEIIDFGD